MILKEGIVYHNYVWLVGTVFKARKIVAIVLGEQLLDLIFQQGVEFGRIYVLIAGNALLYAFDNF